MCRTALLSSAADGAEADFDSAPQLRRWMTATDQSLRRHTGCRCHSAPSWSVAQAWARGVAKVDEDRKLKVPGGGGGTGKWMDNEAGTLVLLKSNWNWLIRVDPGVLSP